MPTRIIRKAIARGIPLDVVFDLIDALDDDLKDIGYEASEKTELAIKTIESMMSPTTKVVGNIPAAPPVENIMTNPELRPTAEDFKVNEKGGIAGALPGGPEGDVNAIAAALKADVNNTSTEELEAAEDVLDAMEDDEDEEEVE